MVLYIVTESVKMCGGAVYMFWVRRLEWRVCFNFTKQLWKMNIWLSLLVTVFLLCACRSRHGQYHLTRLSASCPPHGTRQLPHLYTRWNGSWWVTHLQFYSYRFYFQYIIPSIKREVRLVVKPFCEVFSSTRISVFVTKQLWETEEVFIHCFWLRIEASFL